MILPIKLDEGAIKPTRAYPYDAGLDLYSRDNKTILPHSSAVFDTGVHISLTTEYGNFFGFLTSKSGLNIKHGLTSEGTIDTGYTGSIKVKLYNNSDEVYEVSKGDKISQLLILPCVLATPMVVDELPCSVSGRNDNGFGSSGK